MLCSEFSKMLCILSTLGTPDKHMWVTAGNTEIISEAKANHICAICPIHEADQHWLLDTLQDTVGEDSVQVHRATVTEEWH